MLVTKITFTTMRTARYQSLVNEVLAHLKEIRSLNQEHVLCLSIGSDQRVIDCHTVFIGTLTSALVHPREIFAAAIADHAMEVVVAHNHPSGEIQPSDYDIITTQQLAAAGQRH